MPLYDYICKKCNKRFSETMTITEHETKRVRCPKCGKSKDLKQVIAPFFTKTSKKSF